MKNKNVILLLMFVIFAFVSGCYIPHGTYFPPGTKIPPGTPLAAGSNLAPGSSVRKGGLLAKGSTFVVPAGKEIPFGTVPNGKKGTSDGTKAVTDLEVVIISEKVVVPYDFIIGSGGATIGSWKK